MEENAVGACTGRDVLSLLFSKRMCFSQDLTIKTGVQLEEKCTEVGGFFWCFFLTTVWDSSWLLDPGFIWDYQFQSGLSSAKVS